MNKVHWTWNKRVWQFLHRVVNRLAWKLVPTKDHLDPRNKHWLWRLNNWVANHYTIWYIQEVTGKKFPKNQERNK